MNTRDDSIIQKAALLVRDAEVFIVTAGAGMGVALMMSGRDLNR